jgi:glycine betaine/proline transport system ATP-binding protein
VLGDALRPAVSAAPDTAIADLFAAVADTRVPLAVVGDNDRLLGVIPRVTLLSALGAGTTPEVMTVPHVEDTGSRDRVEVGA